MLPTDHCVLTTNYSSSLLTPLSHLLYCYDFFPAAHTLILATTNIVTLYSKKTKMFLKGSRVGFDEVSVREIEE